MLSALLNKTFPSSYYSSDNDYDEFANEILFAISRSLNARAFCSEYLNTVHVTDEFLTEHKMVGK